LAVLEKEIGVPVLQRSQDAPPMLPSQAQLPASIGAGFQQATATHAQQ
jgi:hypothetical protein